MHECMSTQHTDKQWLCPGPYPEDPVTGGPIECHRSQTPIRAHTHTHTNSGPRYTQLAELYDDKLQVSLFNSVVQSCHQGIGDVLDGLEYHGIVETGV